MAKNDKIWNEFARYLGKKKSKTSDNPSISADQQPTFEEGLRVWDKTAPAPVDFEPNTEKGWQQFQLKVQLRNKENRSIPYLRVAAAIALMIISTWFLYQYLAQPEMISVRSHDLAKELILPDGSHVWLNDGAQITYPETFAEKSREVALSGEAFFEVKKAEGKRFTILTETTKTEVIGTSFNLNATPGQPVKIQVTTGKVAFSSRKDEKSVFLEPGEEAMMEPETKTLETKPIENINYRAWQNKRLIFNNTSLDQVTITLEEYFKTRIDLPDNLENCRFTAAFKDPKLNEILQVLKLTANFKVDSTERGYRITGHPCK